MNWKPSSLDSEIQAVERCIASDRLLLEQAFVGYVDGMRDSAVETIASPKFLLGALGVGFVIGKFLFRPKRKSKQDDAPVAKKSVLGLLGAGAFSLVQAQFGGPLGLARWLTAKAYQARQSTRPSTAAPNATMPGATPDAYAGSPTYAAPSEAHPAALLRR